MRVETADDMAAAMEIDDRQHRDGAVRPVKAQPDLARGTPDHPLFDPIDRQRLALRDRLGLHLRASAGVIASIGSRFISAITLRTCWICG
jgi:hypothetical protein